MNRQLDWYDEIINDLKEFIPEWFKFLEWTVLLAAFFLAYKKTNNLFILVIIIISFALLFLYFWAKLIRLALLRVANFKNKFLTVLAFGFLLFGTQVLIMIVISNAVFSLI